jgi:ABC-type branched-subunit amino acid transport system ATPase component
MPAALEINGLSSGYRGALVVRKLSLEVQQGEIVALLGKNGMGKSTVLKTVMGLLAATAGTVKLLGDEVTGEPAYRVARRAVAYSPQERALFQDLSVEQNLQLGLANPRDFSAQIARVGSVFPVLPQRLKQRAGTLSGGEQKMLLVARALISRPRLMLIDEISEGLQPSVIERLASVLRAERDSVGTAMLLVEQNVSFALSIADRYAVLKLGEIVEQGPVTPGDDVLQRVSHLLEV